jgi:hypothetical protein
VSRLCSVIAFLFIREITSTPTSLVPTLGTQNPNKT